MADPTFRILANLDNPERFVREAGVPVFVPHVRREPVLDEEGKPAVGEDGEPLTREVRVTVEDLQEIADNMNRKLEEFGVLVRISRGHVVIPKADEPPPPEDEQPPIWGWAKNARVGPWGPKSKVGLLTDQYFAVEFHDEAMGYPFRSAEYYPDTNEITGIALLRRDPELDLGILTYARREAPRRVAPEEEAAVPTDDDLDDLLADREGQEQYADDTPGEDDPEDFSPEEAEQYARMFRYAHRHAQSTLDGMAEDDEDRPGVEQMARCYARLAYGGEPGGGNTFVPGDDLDEPPMEPVGDEEEHDAYGRQPGRRSRQYGRAPQRRAEQPRRPAASDARVSNLESQMQEVQRDRQLLRYERQLMVLSSRGLDIDVDEEVEHARDMTEEQRQRQLRMIVRHYGRSIAGGSLVSTDIDDVERGTQRPLTARQRALAQQYAVKHNCTWEQAMAWARQQ